MIGSSRSFGEIREVLHVAFDFSMGGIAPVLGELRKASVDLLLHWAFCEVHQACVDVMTFPPAIPGPQVCEHPNRRRIIS